MSALEMTDEDVRVIRAAVHVLDELGEDEIADTLEMVIRFWRRDVAE